MIVRNRFSLIVVPLIVLWAISAAPVKGKTTCQSTPNGRLCTSEVYTGSFRSEIYGRSLEFERLPRDQQSWIACLSLLYQYYKHPVRTLRLIPTLSVSRLRPWTQMAEFANRRVMDDRGETFKSVVKTTYDFDDRIRLRSNEELLAR